LPGSALRLDVLSLIDKAGNWQSLSLEPIYTAQTFVLAAGFVALVLGLLALDARSFRHVMQGLLGLIALSILVGVAQVATRGLFPSFFTHADTGSLIGFYSNKNHMALAIAASLPLAQIILASDRQKHPIQYLLFLAYWAVALIAILATTSRAGVALGMLASLLMALSMLRRVRLSHRLAIAGAVIVCAALVATSAPFHEIMDRFDYIDNDNRWLFTLRSLPLVRQYWLFGAGGGVFNDLFITYEPIEWVKPTIMNHVHDDYIELVIEYGVPGILALLASGIGIVQAARAIPDRVNRAAAPVRLAGLLIIALIALHSIVDYPLRRPAVLAILAVAIAMVVRPVAPTMHRSEKSRRHDGTLAGR
jgi:O-antigen ligase